MDGMRGPFAQQVTFRRSGEVSNPGLYSITG